nr:hypothetical protein BaRGS_011675 [Batillaria attramentaria]
MRSGPARAPLQQDLASTPFERIAVDILTFPVITENGNNCIIVVCDYYTKYVLAFPLPDHRAPTVADVLVTEVFLQFGTPTFLHSDQGAEFQSALFRHMASLLEIKQTRTCPFRPQSDGQVERMNRSLLDMLSKFCSEHPENWDDFLPYLLCAYRCTPHDSTGCSPNLLMFGKEITLPVDLVYGIDPEPTTPPCPVEYVEWIRDAALEAFQTAKDNLQKNAARQKRNYDRGAAQRQFAVGDWVLRLYPPNMSKSKLNPKYIGPYLITAKLSEVTYRIQRTSKSAPIPVHADHLKRFFSEKLPDSWLPSDDPLARTREQSVQTVDTEGEPETADDATTDNSSSSDSASCIPEIPEEIPRRSRRIRRPPARFGWDSD